ncbi:uncharacterized protein BO95DRAFT_238162 [Aspergillus brunneoviolaceus CBS 621.78]|uniref:Uncharacterized protein n=1 Tax=Aspergillus brunneoviolaceus CBS 621.78 TaxID=1450534 RepID=A0ACD1FZE4_9EURO|nr:hypothetical protein BO95DRAFT_238162 [Aspergillus brunneoviolaceus CBS 621.78]RAH42350.1 hypothetical protein BO95DRAFT_238162 [Aspergillus brunneoviolaceus CBS 621.78]
MPWCVCLFGVWCWVIAVAHRKRDESQWTLSMSRWTAQPPDSAKITARTIQGHPPTPVKIDSTWTLRTVKTTVKLWVGGGSHYKTLSRTIVFYSHFVSSESYLGQND